MSRGRWRKPKEEREQKCFAEDLPDVYESIRCSRCCNFHRTWQKDCLSTHLKDADHFHEPKFRDGYQYEELGHCRYCGETLTWKGTTIKTKYCNQACWAKMNLIIGMSRKTNQGKHGKGTTQNNYNSLGIAANRADREKRAEQAKLVDARSSNRFAHSKRDSWAQDESD